jgi:hypothetical protein
MRISAGQRSGLHMISKGHRPVTVTVQALFDRHLLIGSLRSPRLSARGHHFIRHGVLPPIDSHDD